MRTGSHLRITYTGKAHATKGPTKGLKYPRYEYLVDTDRLNLSRASEMMSIL